MSLIKDYVGHLPLIDLLTDRQHQELAETMYVEKFSKGEIIGDSSKGKIVFGILLNGEAEISYLGKQKRSKTTIYKNELIGEV